uniref:Uncharacterized protein n=1 Tax=Ditylenchus dipsaci TaxID=166011 RepID=A0A915CQ27_9BILA
MHLILINNKSKNYKLMDLAGRGDFQLPMIVLASMLPRSDVPFPGYSPPVAKAKSRYFNADSSSNTNSQIISPVLTPDARRSRFLGLRSNCCQVRSMRYVNTPSGLPYGFVLRL